MTVAVKASQVGSLDMRLEVLVIPVSDVDRAKQFYGGLGWKLDADFAFDDGFRVIQFTPPGSRASVLFGTNVTAEAPGSARDGEIADLRRRVRAARWPDRETVSDPSEGVRTQYRILVNLLADKAGNQWVLWDTGVPQSTLNDPKGWSTLPKLIVYHLDRTITGQLVEIGLKTSDITYVALSHTHGDHIGNVGLFQNSTVRMQRAEYSWISSPDGTNDNVNQLKGLARELQGTPKQLQLLDGDTDIFGDGSVTLVSTPGHPPVVNRCWSISKSRASSFSPVTSFIWKRILQKNMVPSLNTDKAESIASMERVRRMIATYSAKLFINHDKAQSDTLKLLPAFYD